MSKGVTFEEAVEDRYGGSAEADPEVIENIRKDINAPFLQLVGFDKVNEAQKDFYKLRTISVRDKGVCQVDDPHPKHPFFVNLT